MTTAATKKFLNYNRIFLVALQFNSYDYNHDHGQNKRDITMQTIKASEFKAKCLSLMNRVNENNEEIIITKNGKPISRLVPYVHRIDTLFGLHKNYISSLDDLIIPVNEEWEVES